MPFTCDSGISSWCIVNCQHTKPHDPADCEYIPVPRGCPFKDSFCIEEKAAKETTNLMEVERGLIVRVLTKCHGNKYRAAELLGIPRTTLYSKLRKHKIVVPRVDKKDLTNQG